MTRRCWSRKRQTTILNFKRLLISFLESRLDYGTRKREKTKERWNPLKKKKFDDWDSSSIKLNSSRAPFFGWEKFHEKKRIHKDAFVGTWEKFVHDHKKREEKLQNDQRFIICEWEGHDTLNFVFSLRRFDIYKWFDMEIEIVFSSSHLDTTVGKCVLSHWKWRRKYKLQRFISIIPKSASVVNSIRVKWFAFSVHMYRVWIDNLLQISCLNFSLSRSLHDSDWLGRERQNRQINLCPRSGRREVRFILCW